ncbi:MAG: sulfite exporter TauE/SafE family protein [Candidatus Pseudobacter hemicellulosilyticus]|uniref:Sulfite exporter TauE/SafE family protein n=1 Tax=Candidatus Pseudobacter hemicellulosilyticus TaxID=3121375 RepID=A0AAJ5WNX1_9BACT|nr:MAG: sulfite exporter TauE/SafE family protein [Pseudobacter sp.]
MEAVILAGLTLGLVSSLHCVGMCGPLALALPVQHLGAGRQLLSMFLYNTGRVITYSLLGLLFGLAGRHIYLAGFQQWFSIALGAAILVITLQHYFFQHRLQPQWLQVIYMKVHFIMGKALLSKGPLAFLLMGMANGLLPCGMVYLAIAGALSTSELTHSVLFMALFGAGTLPAMLALSLGGFRINIGVRQQLKKAMPYIMVGMAVVLILRGMNLGIPFISPVLAGAPQDAIHCH